MKIQFSVDTTPYPQPRPRVVRGHAFEPKRITNYKNLIRYVAQIHMRNFPPFTNPLFVYIKFRKKRRNTSRSFGDIDNLAKAVLDAMNGIVYSDDAIIIKLCLSKETSQHEGVDISISDTLF